MNEKWQLEMFKRSLKKKQRLKMLEKYLDKAAGTVLDLECDDSGAVSYYLKKDKKWITVEFEGHDLLSLKNLLENDVIRSDKNGYLCFKDNTFNHILIVDVLEHIPEESLRRLFSEIRRVLKKDGTVYLTVPNGEDRTLWLNNIRSLIGMTPEKYGHFRAGFSLKELEEISKSSGFKVIATDGYSKFFTEALELILNYVYIFVFKKGNTGIVPSTGEEFKTKVKSNKMHTILYPFLLLISKLDSLLFFGKNYAVFVLLKKAA